MQVVVFTGETGITAPPEESDGATRTSRLFAVKSEDEPECLLPLANKPLLVHQLELFAAAGLRNVLLVTQEWYLMKIKEHAHHPALTVEVVTVPPHYRAVETLLHIRGKLQPDFVVYNWDALVMPSVLRALLDLHRQRAARLTALLVRQPDPVPADKAGKKGKGGKGKGGKAEPPFSFDTLRLPARVLVPNVNHIFALAGPHLLSAAPVLSDQADSALPIPAALLSAFPELTLFGPGQLQDFTVYACSRWVVDFAKAYEDALSSRSFQLDLLPQLVRRQFSRSLPGGEERAGTSLDTLLGRGRDGPQDVAKCYAYVVPAGDAGLVGRVQTLQGYVAANKKVAGVVGPFTPPGERLPVGGADFYFAGAGASVSGTAVVAAQSAVGARTVVEAGANVRKSIIGAGCVIGEKARVMNSILMDNVTVAPGATITGSLVCANVKIDKVTVAQAIVGHHVHITCSVSSEAAMPSEED